MKIANNLKKKANIIIITRFIIYKKNEFLLFKNSYL